MPTPSKSKLPPLNLSNETIGERIARIRKNRGLTQEQLATIIGIERSRLTAYEIGRLRLYDEMVARFALALNVSTDELLGVEDNGTEKEAFDLKLTKRLRAISELPQYQKKALLNTIDAYLKANEE